MMRKDAFTLIEIIIIVALIGLLAAISVVHVLASRQTAIHVICLDSRKLIENAETSYLARYKENTASLKQLVDTDYLNNLPECKNGGVYAWVPYASTSAYYQTSLGCSFHGVD